MTMQEVAIKKSLNTQQTSYNPMAVKIDSNVEGRVKQQKTLASREWATT